MSVFDYEALHPSVELIPASHALFQFLEEHLPYVDGLPSCLREISDLVTFHSYFIFDGHIFKQNKGVPMGSPMGAILAELSIRLIEKQALHPFLPHIKLYKCYVDDVLIIWDGEEHNDEIVNALSDTSLALHIKLDQCSHSHIHYLDINLSIINAEYSTTVYRKPSYTPIFNPATSPDAWSHKVAAFRALFKHAFTHNTHYIDRYKEIGLIIRHGFSHGYKRNVLVKILQQVKKEVE